MQIEMRDISKAFGQNRVLLGVNLTVRPGEIHALMGENGAGKSTLMNILTGLHKADNGTILWTVRNVYLLRRVKRKMQGLRLSIRN